MEISQLNQVVAENIQLHYMIIPTVLIPLTMVSVAISVVATFIAGLFGIKLKAEGPKQLLEVLLKPKILISALFMNFAILGAIEAYKYVKNLPSFESTIISKNLKLQKLSTTSYEDNLGRQNTANSFSKTRDLPITSIDTIWKTDLTTGVFRGASISSNSLFIGGLNGTAYELNLIDGKVKRQFFIGTMVTPAPLIFNNKIYFGEGVHKTHHARIYKFDLKTGEYISSYSTKGHTEGQPLIASYKNQNLIIAVAGGDGVHAIDPESMKLVWKQNDGHIDSTVSFDDGIIFAGTGRDKGNSEKHRSYATAYHFSTGKRVWKRELPASSWMKPLVMKDQVCFVLGEIYFKSEYGGINCFDKKTGLPMYSLRTLTPIASMPFRLGNSLYFADIHGKVCSVNLKMTGIKKKCFDTKTKGLSFSSVTYDIKRGFIVFASKTNGLYILNKDNLKLVYKWKPKGEDSKEYWNKTYASVTITKDGDYILADMKGKILLIRPTH